jgi:uncharacterized membrane protein
VALTIKFKVKQYPLWHYFAAAIIGICNSAFFAWVAILMGSSRSVALQVLLVFGGLQLVFVVSTYFANKKQLRDRKSRAFIRVVIAFAGAASFATLYFHDRVSPPRGSHTVKVQTDVLSFVAIAIGLLIASRISKNEGK